MSQLIVKTFREASQVVEQVGILPLSGCIPVHPSLESITDPATWITGTDADPWHWRVRFASEGIAVYGRFIGSQPVLISREVFPLVKCVLTPPQTVEECYAAGLLASSSVRIYKILQQNRGIEVRALRKLAGMQDKADKNAFDHAIIDLQNTASIVISGAAENRNEQGKKIGWNGTCHMLAEDWMEEHGVKPLQLSPVDAKTQLFAWLKPRWEEKAVLYLQKKLKTFPS